MTARARIVPAVAFAAMAATVAAGLWLARHDGRELGLAFPPFVIRWDPAATAWALAAAGLFAGAVGAAPRLLSPGLPPAAFAADVFALTLALRLALGAASHGTGDWDHVFDPDGFEGRERVRPRAHRAEVRPRRLPRPLRRARPRAAGPRRRPPARAAARDGRARHHTPAGLAALCIVGGALLAPLAYATGRAVLDERAARIAGLLTACAPSVLLFGATSADALYATLGMLAAWPLASRGAPPRSPPARSCSRWPRCSPGRCSASAPGRPCWPGAATACAPCWPSGRPAPSRWSPSTRCSPRLTGFDPIGAVRATEQVYRFGVADQRPYWFWLTGSPTAFLLVLGLPIAWLALRALADGEDAAVAIFAVLAIAAVAGFTKAEVERIWLSFAPLVCLAAASALPARRLRLVLALLAVQALAWELLWNTVW